MTSNWLLVHSPLVGPSVWEPMVRLLEAERRTVFCPDLTPALDAPAGRRGAAFVARAVDAVSDAMRARNVVVVGFSGAGVFLPSITESIGSRVASTVFVDAVVPPTSGRHELGAPFAAFLDTQTTDGLLAPWLDWWPDAIAQMLPDDALRDAIAADLPRVPRSFYDEVVVVPNRWADRSHRYLQLSSAYEADRERAATFGWPTVSVEGTHLSVATEPESVLVALDRLLR